MTYGNGGDLGDMSMMDLFRMEAENQCNQLSEDLLALEQDPKASDLLESLMRASHSIKGAARVVGLHPVVQVAHAMEDVFVAAQDGKITLARVGIDLLLTGVDKLNSISRLSDTEIENFFIENADEIAALVSSYAALAKGFSSQPKPSDENHVAIPDESPVIPKIFPQIPKIETPQLPVDLIDMSMLDLFRMEAGKHCAKLSEDLVALINDLTSTELLSSLHHASHSLRGAARIVELQEVAKLAQVMEDVFVAAHCRKILIERDDIDILLSGIDLITAITKIPDTETEKWFAEHSSDIDEMIKKLTGIYKREKSTKKTAAPKPPPLKTSLLEPQIESEAASADIPAEPVLPSPPEEKKKPASDTVNKEDLWAVRVSAQNIERMMGLTGESLIESRWLPTFGKELLRLKYRQDELHKYIDTIRENQQLLKADDLTISLFNEMQDKLKLCRSMLKQDMEVLDDHARQATRISNRLYREIIKIKMRPFSEGIRGFTRMVRDVARELGKEVNLEIIGADTMVDRDILDKIEGPLNHLIRNALDHGIELPATRAAMGKPVKGTIQLIARHSAGMLSITVKDDGCGVDLESLRQTISDRKLCPPDLAANLSEHELLEFLFLPKFSTKESISSISGRGVGMDVVHTVVNEVRGKILSSTKLHEGCSFELQLPLTLSVLRALLTEISSELYAFPLVSINHVLQVKPDQIQEIEGRQYFTYNEKRIGIASAQQVFRTPESSAANEEYLHVIVFSDRFNLYGLTVDKLLGVQDLVVQRLDPRLGKVKDINSASILEDGTPVLIIDVEDVFRTLDQLINENRLIRIGSEEEHAKKTKRILVADDSITVREVERKMLMAKGYDVDVAVDGMDAWNTLRANEYDLIISDIDMPRINGFELVSLIKNDQKLHGLPVIIVSYKDQEEERNKGLEVGADYYLSKGSFQDQALVNAVLDLIGEAEE